MVSLVNSKAISNCVEKQLHQNGKPRSQTTQHAVGAIVDVRDAVTRLLLQPLNLPNTTLLTLTSQQLPPATRNDLTRVGARTHSTNLTPLNRDTNINPKPSSTYALNPVTVLNLSATSRPQKSIVDAMTGFITSSNPVKPVQVHK
ncbi:hypothetical protein CISIN_1g0468752mg, partial [Citrus sinensis]